MNDPDLARTFSWLFMPGLLHRHFVAVTRGVRLADLLAMAGAAFVACPIARCTIGSGDLTTTALLALTAALIATGLWPLFALYRPWRGTPFWSEFRVLAFAAPLPVAVVWAMAPLLPGIEWRPPEWWLGWIAGSLGLVLLLHVARRGLLYWLRAHGFNQRHIIVVGADESIAAVLRAIEQRPWAGYRVDSVFSEQGGPAHPLPATLRLVHGLEDLGPYVHTHRIDEVWLTPSSHDPASTHRVLSPLSTSTANIRLVVPAGVTDEYMGHPVTRIAGVPIVNLSASPIVGRNRALKAIEDYLIAAVLIVLTSPLLLAIALGVKLSSPGPVFYRQERLSWNGKPFHMLKFRSMPVDAERQSGAVWARRGDNRATPFGAFLRRTSLDELPQLFNVLMGHMSIVGPRPERPQFVERFKDEVPGYMRKHLVKAGITGWAQVNGWRGSTSLAERIEHDLYYIEHWSLWFDLKIILLTPLKGLIHPHAY